MKKNLLTLLISSISFIKVFSCNANCDVNIDSLFKANLTDLKKLTFKSIDCNVVTKRENLEFIYVVAFLSNKNLIDSKANCINSDTVQTIENWYLKRRKSITCEKLRKAYYLLKPQQPKSIEDIEKFEREMESLIIKD